MSQDQPAAGTIKALSFAKAVGAFLLALATMITAVAGALYIVAPELRPKDQLGGTVEKIAITQDAPYSDEDVIVNPDVRGIEVLVRARLLAYRDRSYSMRIELHEAGTLRRIDAEGGAYMTCPLLSPTVDEETATWTCWATPPPPGTEYFARAILSDNGPTRDLGKP